MKQSKLLFTIIIFEMIFLFVIALIMRTVRLKPHVLQTIIVLMVINNTVLFIYLSYLVFYFNKMGHTYMVYMKQEDQNFNMLRGKLIFMTLSLFLFISFIMLFINDSINYINAVFLQRIQFPEWTDVL